jgi:hypothetical protein
MFPGQYQSAKAFYRKYGFAPLLEAELHLYLSIATIQRLLGRR